MSRSAAVGKKQMKRGAPGEKIAPPPGPAAPKKPERAWLGHPLLPIGLILVLAIYSYWNTFAVPFVFDDQPSITDNPVIKDLANFFSRSDGYRYNPRRFIGYLSLALNYHWGGLDVWGYHLFNLGTHILNGLLVYGLCRLTLLTPRLRESALAPQAKSLALLAALLFTAHPVQTQSVTYIVQRFSSLVTFFYLLSIALYAWARLRGTGDWGLGTGDRGSVIVLRPVPSPQSPIPHSLFTILLFAGSFAAAVLAMKTKEIAFTLPMVVLLYEFSFFRASRRKRLLLFVPVLLALCIVPLSLLGAGKPLGDLLADVDRITRETGAIPRTDYLLTQFTVIATYLRLLILPIYQNLDYHHPIYHTFFTPPVFLSFLLIAGLLAAALWLYRKTGVRNQGSDFTDPRSPVPDPAFRLVAFGILWFFITLSVESSLIPIRDVIFEHRVYLPSVGAFIALAAALVWVGSRLPAKTFWIGAGVLVLVLGTASWQRNMVWGDAVSLWQDTAGKSPGKPRPHYNLGKVLLLEGETDRAIAAIVQALRLDPNNVEARNNLGAAYDQKGWTEQAIEEFRTALRLHPNYAVAHANLGIALEKLDRIEEAIEHYRLALKYQRINFTARLNLGSALFRQGLPEEAIKEFELAKKIDPASLEARLNLAVAYDRMGRLEQAVDEYLAAQRLDRGNAQIPNNLGVIYQNQGLPEKAAEQYLLALQIDPANAMSHVNLGTAYLQMEKPALAFEQFKRAVELDPENVEFLGYLELARQLAAPAR